MDESNELWCIIFGLVEENYTQPLEWGINTGHKVLQVLADSFEDETFENRKDRAGQGRRTSPYQRESSRGLEFNGKKFEAGQRGEGDGHHLG
jgi:hypothetical protein